jgi:hypothetical protein
MLVFLIRIGLAKVDPKEQKIAYNEAITKKVLAQVNTTTDRTMPVIEHAQIDEFIGAYSFITEIEKKVQLIPGICAR